MKIKNFLFLTSLLIVITFSIGCTTQQQEPEISNIETIPSEMDKVQVEPVEETLSFSWKKDNSLRIEDGSVPFVHGLKDGKTRLYYCNNKGILSAISNDGLTFAKESGVRISPGTGFEFIVCDPTIVNLPDGKIRMYYKGANSQNPGPGQSIHKIYSAVS